jgi:nucleotide-binding universal stress UspA family protein
VACYTTTGSLFSELGNFICKYLIWLNDWVIKSALDRRFSEIPRYSATGAALVSAAAEQQATLIVMGAYTHSRLRQSFLGGVTRHLLAHAPVPLLMSH